MSYFSYLTELRNKSGKTLQTISDESGVSISTVKKVFSGNYEFVHLTMIADIVHVIGGSLDELCSSNSEPSHNQSEQIRSLIENDLGSVSNREVITLLHELHRTAQDTTLRALHSTYDELKQSSEKVIAEKNLWLRRLFIYAVTMTVLSAVALTALALMVELE